MHALLYVASHYFINQSLSLSDMPLERKTPVVYPDGVYEIVPEASRGNVLLISNISQHGLSGLASQRRTAFFTFFGIFFIYHKISYSGCHLTLI